MAERRLETAIGVVSILLVAGVVGTWLYLIVTKTRQPPEALMVLAVLGVIGAIASTYRVEDIKALLEVIRR